MMKTDEAVSIGMLRGVVSWPAEEMPEWANTVARRMQSSGVGHQRIVEIIEEMEKARRARVRKSLGNPPITQFDAHLADMLNRFSIKV